MKTKKTDPELLRQVGERLRQKLGNRRMTDAARTVGVKPHTVWSYLNGVALPSPEILVKLAEYLDTSVDWLLTGQESLFADRKAETEFIDMLREAERKGVAEQGIQYMKFLIDDVKDRERQKEEELEREKREWEKNTPIEKLFVMKGLDTLGMRLRYIRVRRLSLAKIRFSKKLGITREELTAVEEGRVPVTGDMLRSYKHYYNGLCSIETLLDGIKPSELEGIETSSL